MRIDNSTHKMVMVRGDTEQFSVAWPEQPFEIGDTVHFTVSKTYTDSPALHIEVTTFEQGIAEFIIPHDATASMDVGYYVYDVRVVRENGDYITAVGGMKESPAVFVLTPEVTK